MESVIDIRNHLKAAETFKHTFCTKCYPLRAKKGFAKGQLFRLLTTNSSKHKFVQNTPGRERQKEATQKLF